MNITTYSNMHFFPQGSVLPLSAPGSARGGGLPRWPGPDRFKTLGKREEGWVAAVRQLLGIRDQGFNTNEWLLSKLYH